MQVDNETERHRERERTTWVIRQIFGLGICHWIGGSVVNPVPVNEYLKMIEIPSCVNETLDYKMAMSLSRVVFA